MSVQQVDRRGPQRHGHAPAMAGVTLASLHAAKGLEWQVVFLPGLTDGTVPIIYAQADEAVEERRLLFVGVTRARHEQGKIKAARPDRVCSPSQSVLGPRPGWLEAGPGVPCYPFQEAPGAGTVWGQNEDSRSLRYATVGMTIL